MSATAPHELSERERLLLWALQDHLPLATRPFARWAEWLGVPESVIAAQIAQWLQAGLITRFGPFIQVERSGGAFALAAISAPESTLEQTIAAINAFPEVAHHYLRTHSLNCWFVIACENERAVTGVARAIEQATGYRVWLFPKEREYFVRLRLLPWTPETAPDEKTLAHWSELLAQTRPAEPPETSQTEEMAPRPLTARERALLIATQAGLPCVVEPFRTVAAYLGWRETEVIETFSALMARGVVRRLGVAVNHYALGYRANAMCVWDVADAAVDAVGAWLAATGAVSHCYRRPRHLPHWRFNLFAMLHGRTQDEVEAQRARLIEACHQRFPQALTAHDALYSTRILKKSGVRLRPTAIA
jgi:DNA-binding Lrp family transcriptional regulator